jgi:pimeloyl-ACP methyl ester carboxylesterase
MERSSRLFHGWLCASAFAATLSAAPAAHALCRAVTVPVSLGPGLPITDSVGGTLCDPDFPIRERKSVELLVHGASYDRTYWDWPTDSPLFSYVDRAHLFGRSTFAIDRLGSGVSSRPNAALLDVASTSWVLHQVVSTLRAAPFSFADVTSTGHSIGSEMVNAEAAVYHDVDRVVLSGFLHRQGQGVPLALTSVYPALLDPKFAGVVTDPNYLTTIPGTRAAIFFDVATTLPAVLSEDEILKDVLSGPELGDALGHISTPAPANESQSIDVPVLIIVGQEDALFCGAGLDCTDTAAVHAFEVPYFSGAPSLTVRTVPKTGHCLALHDSVDLSFALINTWILLH